MRESTKHTKLLPAKIKCVLSSAILTYYRKTELTIKLTYTSIAAAVVAFVPSPLSPPLLVRILILVLGGLRDLLNLCSSAEAEKSHKKLLNLKSIFFNLKGNLHLDFILFGTVDFKYSVFQTEFCSKGYYKGLPLLHNNFYTFKIRIKGKEVSRSYEGL